MNWRNKSWLVLATMLLLIPALSSSQTKIHVSFYGSFDDIQPLLEETVFNSRIFTHCATSTNCLMVQVESHDREKGAWKFSLIDPDQESPKEIVCYFPKNGEYFDFKGVQEGASNLCFFLAQAYRRNNPGSSFRPLDWLPEFDSFNLEMFTDRFESPLKSPDFKNQEEISQLKSFLQAEAITHECFGLYESGNTLAIVNFSCDGFKTKIEKVFIGIMRDPIDKRPYLHFSQPGTDKKLDVRFPRKNMELLATILEKNIPEPEDGENKKGYGEILEILRNSQD